MKEITRKIVHVDINDLKPFPGNPRRNNKSSHVVAKSIEEFGYISPIVCTEDLVVLAGNTRLKALKLLKYKSIDVLVVSGLEEHQIEGFVIADNRVGEYSQWNYAQIDRMASKNDTEFMRALGINSSEKNKDDLESLIADVSVRP